MAEQVSAKLQIPAPVLDAYKKQKLAVFVGSGLSMGKDVKGDFPSWGAIGGRLLDYAAKNNLRAESFINSIRDQLSNAELLEDMLSALESIKAILGENHYRKALSLLFRPTDAAPGAVHRALAKLNVPALLTSNYDQLLELSQPRERTVYTWQRADEALSDLQGGRSVLFKVHGTVEHGDSIILTKGEYDALQLNQSYRRVLEHLWVDHTCLFVGYGMNDPLDFDRVLNANQTCLKSANRDHYVLLRKDGVRSIDTARYLRDFNVRVISYDNHDDILGFLAGFSETGESVGVDDDVHSDAGAEAAETVSEQSPVPRTERKARLPALDVTDEKPASPTVTSPVSHPPAPEVTVERPDCAMVTYDDFKKRLGENAILLMTAVETERNGVLSLMKPLPSVGTLLKCVFKKRIYHAGVLGAHHVVLSMCSMGAATRDGVITATLSAIDSFNPCVVIMPGMAWGANAHEQRFGDVLISSQVIDYELNRVGESLTIHRGAHSESGQSLLNLFRDAAADWDKMVDGIHVSARVGYLLSGDELVNNPRHKAQLLADFPQAIGGEMEGRGLHAAAADKDIEWIVVKGIADWADGSKKEAWQPFAVKAAVVLVERVLSEPLNFSDFGAPAIHGGTVDMSFDDSVEPDTDLSEGNLTVGDSPPIGQDAGDDALMTKTVLRAKNISSAAMAEVWRNFRSDEEPYRSLRRALTVGDMPKAEAVRQIESMMMENILDVLGKLMHWLKQQDRVDGVTAIRKIVDALAATGMQPDFIARARKSLNESSAIRIAVPNWTDRHLSEVILSAIYDEPAIWAVDRYIDLDFSQIEFEDQVSDKTKSSIREQISQEVYGVVTRRAGEDESAFQKRREERTGAHLIATLRQRQSDREPHHFLLDSSARGVKKIMAADPSLWRFVMCLEQTPPGGSDNLVNDLLRGTLKEIFTKLDALRDVR